jgi:hypothetical protein
LCILISGRSKKHQRKASLFALLAMQFTHTEFVAVKIQRLIQISDPDHGV